MHAIDFLPACLIGGAISIDLVRRWSRESGGNRCGYSAYEKSSLRRDRKREQEREGRERERERDREKKESEREIDSRSESPRDFRLGPATTS